jgi:hypothetical protein
MGLFWIYFKVTMAHKGYKGYDHGLGESLCQKLCYSDHNHCYKGVGK